MSDNIGKASLVQLRKLCVIFVCQIIFLLTKRCGMKTSLKKSVFINLLEQSVSYNTAICLFVQNDQ